MGIHLILESCLCTTGETNFFIAQRSITSLEAVDSISVYLGLNGRRHPSSCVDLRAEYGRDYGPVTVSMVERISRVPEWIPDTSSTSVGVCVLLPSKKRKRPNFEKYTEVCLFACQDSNINQE